MNPPLAQYLPLLAADRPTTYTDVIRPNPTCFWSLTLLWHPSLALFFRRLRSSSEVGAWSIADVDGARGQLPSRAARHCPRWKLAHLLELLAGRDLLGEQRRLDAVEQAFQPADELRLGDAQLAVGRDLTVLERKRKVA